MVVGEPIIAKGLEMGGFEPYWEAECWLEIGGDEVVADDVHFGGGFGEEVGHGVV